MDNAQQTKNVKKALDLENRIEETNDELIEVKSEMAPAEPEPPVRQTVQMNEPEMELKTKFKWKILLLCWGAGIALSFVPGIKRFVAPVGAIIGPIAYCIVYNYKKKTEMKEIKNSVEYKNKCAQAQKEFDEKTVQANALFEKQTHEYKTVIMPEYRKRLEIWTTNKNNRIQEIEHSLMEMKNELASHYECTKIVPLQYRTIYALQYIYDVMSTSDYDIKEATNAYDKNEQRILEEARLREQQQANALAVEQNELAAEQNEIARKARRDANMAAFTSAVQHHNTNKMIKKHFK